MGYPCVLVRLARIHPDALRDLLAMSYRFVTRSPRAAAPAVAGAARFGARHKEIDEAAAEGHGQCRRVRPLGSGRRCQAFGRCGLRQRRETGVYGRYNGMLNTMRTTMDAAGRLVIPKEVRQQAQIRPGMPLEVRLREGHIEIEPAPLDITIRRRGRLAVAVPHRPVAPLTSATVEETRRRLRRDRAGD